MAHDVFVSCSSQDKPQADVVCAALEAEGISCWVASRDIVPGQEWARAIVDAIQSSRVVVLVFSSHAVASHQIRREVELAVSSQAVLITLRIEAVAAESLDYFLGTSQWLDALTPPLENHLGSLIAAVKTLLPTNRTSAVTSTAGTEAAARGGADVIDPDSRGDQQRRGVFLCYRRDDSRWQAGRLADALTNRFGEGAVFMDVDRLRIGNWRKQIDQSLSDCAALIVVIGPQWLAALEQRSASDDQVRYEISKALALDKIIIPVAVDRAPLPQRGELPEDIAALSDAQGYELGVDRMWRPTVGQLLDDLNDALQERSISQTPGQSLPKDVVTQQAPPVVVGNEAQVQGQWHEAFISCVREDADAARRLQSGISALGGNVWLDERWWEAGDEVATPGLPSTGLFIPIISMNTERMREGHIFREWREAAKRSRSIQGRFMMPVVVDRDYEGDPNRYRQLPAEFKGLDFGHAPGGEPDAALKEALISEIRAMRRRGDS